MVVMLPMVMWPSACGVRSDCGSGVVAVISGWVVGWCVVIGVGSIIGVGSGDCGGRMLCTNSNVRLLAYDNFN